MAVHAETCCSTKGRVGAMNRILPLGYHLHCTNFEIFKFQILKFLLNTPSYVIHKDGGNTGLAKASRNRNKRIFVKCAVHNVKLVLALFNIGGIYPCIGYLVIKPCMLGNIKIGIGIVINRN